jgi:hypothetical protein
MLGLEVDLARALAGLMNLELQIVDKPFGDLLGALAGGIQHVQPALRPAL